MLANIRVPYLNIDSRTSPLSHQTPRNIDFNEPSSSSSSWANIRYLTNEERDQIDLQARVILTRCSDRVKEMEVLEKRVLTLFYNEVTHSNFHYCFRSRRACG